MPGLLKLLFGIGMSAKFGLHVGNMKFNNRMKKELVHIKFYV
jgi:hypothetical protein